jgi:hypothetical protein
LTGLEKMSVGKGWQPVVGFAGLLKS